MICHVFEQGLVKEVDSCRMLSGANQAGARTMALKLMPHLKKRGLSS